MSKPDTNQASENELKAIIEWYVDRTAVLADQDGRNFNNKHLLKLDMRTAIEDLIRTEKLKLLAEVRERVVGELSELDSNGRYNLKVEQRVELTKLEAEL